MIKKWYKFISESNSEPEESFWKLMRLDIEQFMYEITDAGYQVIIHFGFKPINNPSNILYTLNPTTGYYKPTYAIIIDESCSKRRKYDDVTTTFEFLCSIIKDQAQIEEFTVSDFSDKLDPDTIEMNYGGIYADGDEIDAFLELVFVQNNKVYLDSFYLAKYYNWSSFITKNNNIYVEIPMGYLVDSMLSHHSDYVDVLKKGVESMDKYYFSGDYKPSFSEIFDIMNNKNIKLMIDALISIDGLENFIEDINIDDKEKLQKMDKTEIINFISSLNGSRRWQKNDITNVLIDYKNHDIIQEIQKIISWWRCDAHMYDNYEQLIEEFDRIVGQEFSFIKTEKEVEKKYSYNGVEKTYTNYETFYLIEYRDDWLESTDIIKDCSLLDIFDNWLDNQYFSYKMNPRLSDWGSVDEIELNSEIESIIEDQMESMNYTLAKD